MVGGGGSVLQNVMLEGSPEASSTSPSTIFHGHIASVLAEQVSLWEGMGLCAQHHQILIEHCRRAATIPHKLRYDRRLKFKDAVLYSCEH